MSRKKVNEQKVVPSKLSAGATYRVVSAKGSISTDFEASLDGIDWNGSFVRLSFDNGVTIEGEGADLSSAFAFYRRTW